jgi:N-acetyltransferase
MISLLMTLDAVTLEGRFVRLEPLALTHVDALAAIGLDPDLWKWTTTSLRTPGEMREYVQSAVDDRAAGRALPFATIERATGATIGCTRFANISVSDKRVEIGWTWVAGHSRSRML